VASGGMVRMGSAFSRGRGTTARQALWTHATWATHYSRESHRSHLDLLSAAWPPLKRDQFPAANLARFLAGLGRGEPEGRDCGLGVALLLGLFITIN
jgi:hypothetical protein